MTTDLVDDPGGHPASTPAAAGVDDAGLEALLERAGREVEEGLLPSCQVAVARQGRLVLCRTLGAGPLSRYSIYSTTKAITAGAVWRLLDTTDVNPATPVAGVLPEFEEAKAPVTVEHLLTHTAGLAHCHMPNDDWPDPARRSERLASWEPAWEPGSRFEYHPRAAHWALAAIIEAVTGRDFREFTRAEVLDPLGLAALTLGTPAIDQADVLDVVAVGEAPDAEAVEAMAGATGLDVSAIDVGEESLLEQNDPAVRALGQPGGGAIGRAADLAMYYQALLADPGGLWSEAVLRAGTAEIHCALTDPMTGVPANRSLGLVVAGDDGNAFLRGFGATTSPAAFGHMGAGGQIAWADPATGVSFAYLTNGLDRDLFRMGARGHELATLAGEIALRGG